MQRNNRVILSTPKQAGEIDDEDMELLEAHEELQRRAGNKRKKAEDEEPDDETRLLEEDQRRMEESEPTLSGSISQDDSQIPSTQPRGDEDMPPFPDNNEESDSIEGMPTTAWYAREAKAQEIFVKLYGGTKKDWEDADISFKERVRGVATS